MKRFLKIAVLSIFLSPLTIAQELTSDIAGTIRSSDGALSGATVVITYEPTNSSVIKTTDSSGRYLLVVLGRVVHIPLRLLQQAFYLKTKLQHW